MHSVAPTERARKRGSRRKMSRRKRQCSSYIDLQAQILTLLCSDLSGLIEAVVERKFSAIAARQDVAWAPLIENRIELDENGYPNTQSNIGRLKR